MEHISRPIARILDDLLAKDAVASGLDAKTGRQLRRDDLAEGARFRRLKSRKAELVCEIKIIDDECGRIIIGHSSDDSPYAGQDS